MMARRWDDIRAARARHRLLNFLAIVALLALVAVAADEWASFEVTRAAVAAQLGRMP